MQMQVQQETVCHRGIYSLGNYSLPSKVNDKTEIRTQEHPHKVPVFTLPQPWLASPSCFPTMFLKPWPAKLGRRSMSMWGCRALICRDMKQCYFLEGAEWRGLK